MTASLQRVLIISFPVFLAGVSPSAVSGQSYARLADSDFVVAGVSPGLDSAVVHKTLGAPLFLFGTSWRYHGIEVVFDGGRVDWVRVTSGAYQTRRGLRVGDPEARIAKLYGVSCGPTGYVYCGPDDHRGIMVIVHLGKVAELRIGPRIDHD